MSWIINKSTEDEQLLNEWLKLPVRIFVRSSCSLLQWKPSTPLRNSTSRGA